MQIPILNGIYTDTEGNFRTSYPKNLIPIPTNTGINRGYLRPGYGIIEAGTGPGLGRGGINWNNELYRAMGTKLTKVSPSGVFTTIGDIGGTEQVTMDYSFDYLAVSSNSKLYLYDGTTLTQVTDADLGNVIDFVWLEGRFVCTDGEFLVVTELNNPFSVKPIKYGSSELDPDPILSVTELRNELVALNRYTIEFFENVGGDGFPYQRIEGAQIQRGTVGTHANTIFNEVIAFVGGGKNEKPAVWIAYNGKSQKISTREIDKLLGEYTESQLSQVLLESRYDDHNQQLLIKLSNKTLVYDINASNALKQSVWYILHSGQDKDVEEEYRAQNFVWCYDRWNIEDTASEKVGYLTETVSTHFGEDVAWDFTTSIIYNDTKGAIVHELELVCLTGNVALSSDPTIYTDYSLDGLRWSMPRPIKSGKQGVRSKRLLWTKQGHIRDRRIQRFYGSSESHLTIARLEGNLEPLYV